MHLQSRCLLTAAFVLLGCAGLIADDASLNGWKSGIKIAPVSTAERHSIHAYFNTSPESPDGRWVLFYASTTPEGHVGDIVIRERATGNEIVLAEKVSVEDAHRAACQQWLSGGRRVAFHTVSDDGVCLVHVVDVDSKKA